VHPIGLDLPSGTLRFQLLRTTQNKDVWTPLLQYPISEPVRPLHISVGLQGQSPLLTEGTARAAWLFVIGFNWWTVSWVLVFVILLVIFVVFAIFSNILRSPEPEHTGRLPYSLSRTQAGFWLFLVAGSFVFIWVVTGDLSTLNASILALIGISAGTYLASAMLEDPPGSQNPAGGAPLGQTPAASSGAGSGTASAAGSSPASTTAATGAPTGASPTTKAHKVVGRLLGIRFIGVFLADILSDEQGVSIPRFQIFVWTIVLGIMFVVSVCNQLSMPEFNGTLLALMGISSATYVGAKLTR